MFKLTVPKYDRKNHRNRKKPSPLTHIYMTAHFEDLVHVVQ